VTFCDSHGLELSVHFARIKHASPARSIPELSSRTSELSSLSNFTMNVPVVNSNTLKVAGVVSFYMFAALIVCLSQCHLPNS
jgi:hypothetical protein